MDGWLDGWVCRVAPLANTGGGWRNGRGSSERMRVAFSLQSPTLSLQHSNWSREQAMIFVHGPHRHQLLQGAASPDAASLVVGLLIHTKPVYIGSRALHDQRLGRWSPHLVSASFGQSVPSFRKKALITQNMYLNLSLPLWSQL